MAYQGPETPLGIITGCQHCEDAAVKPCGSSVYYAAYDARTVAEDPRFRNLLGRFSEMGSAMVTNPTELVHQEPLLLSNTLDDT